MQGQFVLVVDDDADMAQAIAETLTEGRYHCEVAGSGESALAACRRQQFEVAVSDVRMPGMDGIELMKRLRHVQPDLPVVLITADGSIDAAVEAMKGGASQYLTKPFLRAQLRAAVEQAMAARVAGPHADPRTTSRSALPSGTEELVGDSPAMTELRSRIELVAAARSAVLVSGETGTGKELVARAIHACSERRSRAFVTVNAAAIPDALLESEMFGHVRGAFTGATTAHRGLFSEADGGTILLDEIGDMPLGLQAKLLRVLQTGEIRPVGAERAQQVDVRIVAATHRKLADLVRDGRFREDLFYRLNVIAVKVPPLRERTQDIPQLALSFLSRARRQAPDSPVRSITADVVHLLGRGNWPGNVRELQSVIESLVVLARAEQLEPRHLALVADIVRDEPVPASARSKTADRASSDLCTIDELVRRHVKEVLAHTYGNKAKAAKVLGVDLSTLYRWQQKWQP